MIGKISEREFIKEFLSASKLNITIEEYIEVFKKGIEPIPGMKEILESLKARYHLATLINESSEWANYKLDVSKFREFFEINVVSGDIGYAKPEAAFYMRALEMLKAKPAECIFTDDKKENCDAAKNLGIEAILFRNPEQLRKELASYSIRLS
jgi:putative hydrolase of the HAD superfamily